MCRRDTMRRGDRPEEQCDREGSRIGFREFVRWEALADRTFLAARRRTI